MAITVLVTGGSSFLGSHVVAALLQAGHTVRATVRAADRAAQVRAAARDAGVPDVTVAERLSVVEADLSRDAGWGAAAAGCTAVVHVVAPSSRTVVKHESEMTEPIVEGTLRVLRAARDAGVKRVVLTGTESAVRYAPNKSLAYDESMWSDPAKMVGMPYHKAKVLAEKAAWDFVAAEGVTMELVTILPGGIIGPVLGEVREASLSGTVDAVRMMLRGEMPALPLYYLGYIDARDLAELHVLALTHEGAAGQRFLADSAPLSLAEVSSLLRARLPAGSSAISRLPTRELPNFLIRVLGSLMPAFMALVAVDVGQRKVLGPSEKVARVLGWSPRREVGESLADTAA
ncbi:hypothetical protein HK405_010677, partial [Cladochytrium tenue]